jgi:isoquinoline 1-oxidoreductase beta subunit
MTLDHIAFPPSDQEKSAPEGAVSRRSFLQVGAAAGGGLLLSVSLPFARDQAEAI